jgi:hypothetical protein
LRVDKNVIQQKRIKCIENIPANLCDETWKHFRRSWIAVDVAVVEKAPDVLEAGQRFANFKTPLEDRTLTGKNILQNPIR